jgi:hypothetical protein
MADRSAIEWTEASWNPATGCSLIYQVLDGGAVVSTRSPCNNRACRFTGHCSDKLTFPAASLGMPPTLQVVVKAAGHTVKLESAITAHR